MPSTRKRKNDAGYDEDGGAPVIKSLSSAEVNAYLQSFASVPLRWVGSYRLLGTECFLFDPIAGATDDCEFLHEVIVEASCSWKVSSGGVIVVSSEPDDTDGALEDFLRSRDEALSRFYAENLGQIGNTRGLVTKRASLADNRGLRFEFLGGIDVELAVAIGAAESWEILRSRSTQISCWRGQMHEVASRD